MIVKLLRLFMEWLMTVFFKIIQRLSKLGVHLFEFQLYLISIKIL